MRFSVAFSVVFLVGCPSTVEPTVDAGAFLDAEACASDEACDDDLFCTGEERCIDSRCVHFRSACGEGRVCDEAMDRCLSSCGVADDGDGDGVDAVECGGLDCDDGDADRRPGATEVCDAVDHDEDCDPSTFGVRDLDLDGYADAACCNGDACGNDCDDTRSGAHPSAPEVCNGTDDDCDGDVDEGVLPDWLVDLDGDGFGSDASGPRVQTCERPDGHADLGGDCDDDVAAIHPGALERCDLEGRDEDCNGLPDDVPGGCDCTDGTSRMCGAGGRCAGATQACAGGRWSVCSIEPVPETCDGTDEDCNGTIDDGLRVTCYRDADGDGRARGDAVTSQECSDPARSAFGGCPTGFTNRVPTGLSERDCNDGDAAIAVAVVCYADADVDTYGTGAVVEQCVAGTACPSGFASRAGDCCDLDSRAHPNASYAGTPRTGCGGWDFNCDGAERGEWDSYTAVCSARATSGVCTLAIVPGWSAGSVPACGASADFVRSCAWGGSCVPNMRETMTRACR